MGHGHGNPSAYTKGRGFNSSLIYFAYAIDAWSQKDVDGLCDQKFVDLLQHGGPAHHLNGTGYFGAMLHLPAPWLACIMNPISVAAILSF